jgi:uncharacterized protein (DUF885 family)
MTIRRGRPALAWFIACALLAPGLSARQQVSGESVKLKALADEFAAQRAGGSGRRGAVLDSYSPSLDRAREQAAWAVGFLPKLRSIDASKLTHDESITDGLMEFEATLSADAERFFWFGFEVTPYSSPVRTLATQLAALPIRTEADRLAYLDALHQVPGVMAAYEARLRSQMARGIILPADELDLVVPFIRTLVADPPSSGFAVAPTRLAGLSADERKAFQAQTDAAIGEVVSPAVERLAAFLNGPYRAKALRAVGVGQYPSGQEYYRHLIWQHTGLDLTPEAIHRVGLAEVTRLNGELEKVRLAAGFQGSIVEFRHYLKTDPRFFPKTGAEIGEAMMAAIRRIEPKIDAFFLKKPTAPYGVLRLDAALEPSMTYGYYQMPAAGEPRGLYRFNGSKPEERSLLMAAATIYHELIPGHHFQLGLRAENERLTGFRRAAMYTAFTEGWAEYASDLAGEMGMYDDPYARAGRLAMDLFLSSRLVVDTGMNALGWSRERAMAFMRENTLESDVQIGTETLRYSADMPGQALAYKLGALKIHELRDRTQQALGDRFDIRRFHEYLLDAGSMPLGVLEVHIGCLTGEKHLGVPH